MSGETPWPEPRDDVKVPESRGPVQPSLQWAQISTSRSTSAGKGRTICANRNPDRYSDRAQRSSFDPSSKHLCVESPLDLLARSEPSHDAPSHLPRATCVEPLMHAPSRQIQPNHVSTQAIGGYSHLNESPFNSPAAHPVERDLLTLLSQYSSPGWLRPACLLGPLTPVSPFLPPGPHSAHSTAPWRF